jgi:elongation factor G
VKEYAVTDIRNIALVSHQSVGKTTLAEGMLFSAGASNRMGTIDDGTTTSDYRKDEIDRKISISATLMHYEWKKKKFNILDLPGYQDFVGEVISGLRVADMGVLLLNAVAGVEVGTQSAWEILNQYECPRVFFVNRQDKEHANFDKAVQQAKTAYGNEVIAVQFPLHEGEAFDSVVDVLRMKKISFSKDGSGKYSAEDIPADVADKAKEMRKELIEQIAESDDELLETYFEAGELTPEEIESGLRKAILERTIFPVLCGNAAGNMGTQTLMDFLAAYGPSPQDGRSIKAKDKDENEIVLEQKEDDPFASFVFKTFSELHVGELSLIRVYSGQIKPGEEAYNISKGSGEKVGQMYLLNGRNRMETNVLKAGDIGALVKLKDTHTSNTLCDKNNPVIFDPIDFPEPVVDVAIDPRSKGDEEKISNGLHTLHEIDPSFQVRFDPELRQTVVSGQGELHITIIIQRLKERFGVEVDQKKPKIPYRETIVGKSDEKYRHKKQSGGAGQFAEVWMRLEPLKRGEGFEFESKVVGGAISQVFIPSIEKGIKQVLDEGALAGYKIVDVKAIVYDGKEHPVDSKDIAFQIAGREVFKMCFKSAQPLILEPIYNIQVKCPEEFMGDVMGDLSSRRGKILGMESEGQFQVVKAKIPLAELHGYATTLRSMTQGRATYSRQFSHYDPLPKELESRVIQESKEDEE